MPMPMSSQIKAGREGVGLFENALSMLTSAAGEPAAGMVALAELIRGGDSGAARDAVRQAFAYQPRTDAGQRQQRMLGELAASAMNSAPVRTWQKGVDIAGRYSPAAGAALQTIPTAIGVATGAKPAMQQGRALSELAGLAQNRMVQNAMVPGSINTGPIGRQKGVFAGVNALNANKVALAKAQDMAAKGASPDDIWMETGWALAPDGKWRFEISDADARLVPAIKSLDRGGYDAADIQEVTYRKNNDGTYSVALMHEGAKDSSGFVNLDSVPEEVVRAILPDDVFAAVRRGDGEADFIGANLDDAKLIKSPFKFEGMNALPLDMVIDHPALFAEYPDLRRAFVRVDPKAGIGGSMAEMDNGTLVITVGSGQKQSTMLHEIQHAIQNYEGFATGGSHADAFADPRMRPGATKKTLAAANRLLAEKLADLRQPDSIERFARMAWNTDEITPALEASYADYVKTVGEAAVTPNIQRAAQEWASKEWYRRLAGEVEARNVQARMHMTAQERRAKLPRTTADVAEGDQIVRHTNSTNELRRTGGR